MVDWITVIQHTNGITSIQHAYGDTNSGLTSSTPIPSTLAPNGTGSGVFAEFASDRFTVTDNGAGTFHRFVINKSSDPTAFASYRWYVQFHPVPEPSTVLMLSLGIAVVGGSAAVRRRTARCACDVVA